ncbi:MAG: bifunctional 4-hydroxy-2-oxoglutarate aldolase/2-dehydro-3-deoxy-phosphogluconate aldolase [Thermodesulfobacteriota bacterium]|nr:bifunctional 4-hydroxy-2-oxoglutarate aldolase/2-dehydro-3-deoxy-phosphogluconate aldolase [Thermodesulfobacteriota bacterium]
MDISILDEQRILIIIRHNKPFDLEGLFQAVLESGLNTIEITLNTPQALELIERASRTFGDKMFIGAGTVLSLNALEKARDAGARFIVSPVFDSDIVEYCSKRSIPIFPGALTPTEVYHAYEAGAYMVKLFPASLFGPSYIKSIKAPLSGIKILAVGGVQSSNLKEYISYGADAVAIGSGVIKPDWIDSKDFQSIKDSIITFQSSIRSS